MSIHLEVVRVISAGLLQINRSEGGDFDTALWSQVKARRGGGVARRRCPRCERLIQTGDSVYAPVGNQSYRGERVHGVCLTLDVQRAQAAA